MQTASLQRQLAVVHGKADYACAETERTHQQAQAACAAVQEIITAVTQMAEVLDDSGASQELTRSFEAVAECCQNTFQAVSVTQAGLIEVQERQQEVKDACVVSPLLASGSVAAGLPQVAGALKELEQDAMRCGAWLVVAVCA